MRAIVLSATLAALFTMWMHQPDQRKYYPGQVEIPLIVNDPIDYCVVDYRFASKMPNGEYRFGWGDGYGPCKLQDKFFEI